MDTSMIYAVRVVGDISKRGDSRNTRRRGGLVFGPEEIMLSTGEHEGVELVSKEQLAVILADEMLRHREVPRPPQVAVTVAEVDDGGGGDEMVAPAQTPAAPRRGRQPKAR